MVVGYGCESLGGCWMIVDVDRSFVVFYVGSMGFGLPVEVLSDSVIVEEILSTIPYSQVKHTMLNGSHMDESQHTHLYSQWQASGPATAPRNTQRPRQRPPNIGPSIVRRNFTVCHGIVDALVVLV